MSSPNRSDQNPESRGKSSAQQPIWEALKQFAAEGNFQAILQRMQAAPRETLSLGPALQLLQVAIDNAVRTDPMAMTDTLFATMISFDTYVMFRQQIVCELALEQSSRGSVHDRSGWTLPEENLFVQLREIQTNLAKLCQAWAVTMRGWQLARHKKTIPASRPGQEPNRPQPEPNGTHQIST